jgi:hypothetical protein
MKSPTRNEAYGALFALVQEGLNPTPFKTVSRKFRDPSQMPAEEFPYFLQTEHRDLMTQHKIGMPYTRLWKATWIVWFRSDPTDPLDWPTVRMNDYLDALEAALADFTNPDERQTLGDLVDNVVIDGDVIKIPGDEEGLGVLMIPITMLVPGIAGTPGIGGF